MLRIQLLSDVHAEFHHKFQKGAWHGDAVADQGEAFVRRLNPRKVDVLVLAGDITTGEHIPETLAFFAKKYRNSQILYVLGNHEYYGEPNYKTAVWSTCMDLCEEFENLHWLENNSITIKGHTFHGTTLWYPATRESMILCPRWSDFHVIPHAEQWLFEANKLAREYLRNFLRKDDIVISHMLPTFESTRRNYDGDPWNCFFVSDEEKLILEREPKLWLHGHTHDCYDYVLGKTRIVSNPYGYQKVAGAESTSADFEWKKIIEVD